jgi:hypothetical protein
MSSSDPPREATEAGKSPRGPDQGEVSPASESPTSTRARTSPVQYRSIVGRDPEGTPGESSQSTDTARRVNREPEGGYIHTS